jgi:hypothetical protein
MSFPIPVSLTVDIDMAIPIVVSNSNVTVPVGLATPILASIVPEYDGDYDITPTSTAQVFQTNGKKLTHDFVVEPIPSNYGLITWDGSTITVS